MMGAEFEIKSIMLIQSDFVFALTGEKSTLRFSCLRAAFLQAMV